MAEVYQGLSPGCGQYTIIQLAGEYLCPHHLFHHAHLHLCVKTAQLPRCPTWPFLQSRPQQLLVKNHVHAWLVIACPSTFCWYVPPVHSNCSLVVTHLQQMMVTEPAFLSTSRRLYFWVLTNEALCWAGVQQPSALGITHDPICRT